MHISQNVKLFFECLREFHLRCFWVEMSFPVTLNQTWQRSHSSHHLSSALFLFWEMSQKQTSLVGELRCTLSGKSRGNGEAWEKKGCQTRGLWSLNIPSAQWQMYGSTWSSPHGLRDAGRMEWHLVGSGNKQKLSVKTSASGRELLTWQNKARARKQTPLFTGIRRRKCFSGDYMTAGYIQ